MVVARHVPVLSISNFASRKRSAPTPQICTSTMSPCSRGAISQALGRFALPLSSKPCLHRIATANLPRFRTLSAVAKSAASAQQLRPNLCRGFSTSCFLQSRVPPEELTEVLPICCPGCGAPSQTIEPNEPGYYSTGRKQTRKLLASRGDAIGRQATDLGDVAEPISGGSSLEDAELQQRSGELPAPKPIQGK